MTSLVRFQPGEFMITWHVEHTPSNRRLKIRARVTVFLQIIALPVHASDRMQLSECGISSVVLI